MKEGTANLILRHSITCHRAPVTALRYDDKGELMFSASADSTVVIHELHSDPYKEPKTQCRLRRYKALGINAITYEPGKLLTAGDDAAVLWDINMQKPMFFFDRHELPITDCDMHENYALLASADQTLSFQDMRQKNPISIMRAHTGSVLSCKLIKKSGGIVGEKIAAISGGQDGMIRLWNPVQGNAVLTTKPGKPVSSIEVSPNERYILCSHVGLGAVLHALPGQQSKMEITKIKEYTSHSSSEFLLPASYTWLSDHSTQMVTCGTSQDQIVMYDIKTSEHMLENPIPLSGPPLTFASSSHNQLLGVGCMDARIHLYTVMAK